MEQAAEKPKVQLSDILSEQEQSALILAYTIGKAKRGDGVIPELKDDELAKVLFFAAVARIHQRAVDGVLAGKLYPYVEDGEVRFAPLYL